MRKSAISPKLVIPIIAFYCFCNLDAQVAGSDRPYNNVEFERIGESEGVPKVSRCIFVDSKGFVWFGTDIGGLYRYDGYDFEAHKYIYNDSTSISSNWVYSILHEDPAGDLWINAGLKLNRYNRDLNNFTRFDHNPDDHGSIIAGMITSVISDSDGNIWIGSFDRSMDRKTGGLCMYDREAGSFIRFINDPGGVGGISSNYITCLHPGDSGSVWAGTLHSGIDRIIPAGDAGGYRIINYRFNSESSQSEPTDIISSIAVDGEGVTWFGTGGGGLLKYDSATDEIKRYPVHPVGSSPGNYISLLSIDNNGELWLGTGDGLAKYDRLRDSIILYSNDTKNPGTITPGTVVSLTHGIDGACWVVTNNNTLKPSEGICRFDPASAVFKNYREDRDAPGGLPTNYVTGCLADNNGILWISTLDGGINRFDPNKRKFNLYSTIAGTMKGMPPGKIYSLLEDSQGILWIGTSEYGLYRLDRESGKITNFRTEPGNPKSLINNSIQCICEGEPGTLWLGGLGGLKKLDTQTLEFRSFVSAPGIPASLTEQRIMSIFRDNSGILWLGTIGGLARFDPVTEEFRYMDIINQGTLYSNFVFYVTGDSKGTLWLGTPEGLVKYIPGEAGKPDTYFTYRNESNNPNSLSYNLVRMVVEDDSGSLWIATEGGGLNRFNPRDESFKVYTEEDGLPNNMLQGILIDEYDNLWISTLNGISKFNPRTGIFRNYDRSDGLQSNEFTFGTFNKSKTGEMFFGGEMGINYFFPDRIITNPNVPPVVLTGFRLNNRPVGAGPGSPLEKTIGEVKLIELSHDENFLTFEFAALNYTNSHKNRYKYIMVGLDPDTVYAGTRRIADFPGMKPGSYTFWVTGSNNDGLWNEKGVSVKIIIHPPWWRSNLAYGLYLAMILIGLAGFVRWRTWSLRRDKLRLEMQVRERTIEIEKRDLQILELDRIKTRFFTNISHEFRTLITLILSPVEEILANPGKNDRNNSELNLARINARRLSDLVNQLLDLSKLDSGKMKLQLAYEDIIYGLKILFSSYISLADRRGINYNFSIPGNEFITFYDRSKVESIMNNLLSNAFKCTPDGGSIDCNVQIRNEVVPGKEPGIEISVSDNGPGIDPDKQALIFDRFYQGNEKFAGDGSGTGIGLSLTRELVNLMHGEIKVNSSPGAGTSFTVTIPLGMNHLEESEYNLPAKDPEHNDGESDSLSRDNLTDLMEATGDSDRDAEKKAIKILVVEDNRDMRIFLKEKLELDWVVIESMDGEDGFNKALQQIPDLILSDIMMPGMDGIEFCRKIKTNERTSHIPVVLLTALADQDDRIKGLETGADDYIAKPFSINELRTRIRNLIKQRELLREKFSSDFGNAGKEISFNSYDMKFYNKIVSIVEDHLGDFDFDVEELREKAGLSHSQLYRKLYALTGFSPSRFICNLRLKRAISLMEKGNNSITRIAFDVGFNNISYFSKCFKNVYSVTPSVYLRQLKGGEGKGLKIKDNR